MNIFRITTLALVVASTLSACNKEGKAKNMPPLSIEVAQVTTRQLKDQIYFATTTSAIRSITIEPRVSGYLRSIDYESGSLVKAGEVIFTIDPTQIDTELLAAEATLESAQASLTEARNNYLRAIPLAKIDAISRSSLDEYTATYKASQASVRSAEQSLRSAELNSSYTTITSPIDGVIADSPANEGDYVGVGTAFSTLTTISDIDSLNLNLAIPTSKYLQYKSRGKVNDSDLLSNIELILPDSSIYPYLGAYNYTQQSASSGSSTIVIVAKFPNPELLLKGGIFARVRANIGEEMERIVIPQRAVTQMQGVNSVWVIASDSTASYREVTLGRTYGDEWQVISGLQSGDRVATTGQIKLHEGMKISPIFTTEDKTK